MPLPKLTDLTEEQQAQVEEAHRAWLRADAFEGAIQLLEEDTVEFDRKRWEEHVIPVLRAEHDKADAEHWQIMRELGYEGS